MSDYGTELNSQMTCSRNEERGVAESHLRSSVWIVGLEVQLGRERMVMGLDTGTGEIGIR